MKKAIVLVVALAAVGAGWKAWPKKERRERPQRAVEAAREDIERSVEATGQVWPLNRVEVKPQISGRIEDLLVEEGEKVKAGQVIGWMSSNDRAAILDAARAKGHDEYERWKESYKATPIVAPLAGTIIARNVVVGETVGTGTTLFVLADELVVLAQVDESEIGRIDAGMPARVALDAYPEVKLRGKVARIKYEGANQSNVITYGVRVRLEKAPAFLRSQMTASVSFIVGSKKDAVVIPAALISETGEGKKQVTLDDGTKRDVVTGIESGDRVEIVAGLSGGERLVSGRGRYRPQEGPGSSPLAMGSRPGQARTGSGGGSQSRRRGTASR